MLYRVRHQNKADDYLFGTWIDIDGNSHRLENDDYTITALSAWKSSASGSVYPQNWRIQVPKKNVDIQVIPTVKNQELYFGKGNVLTYWEGRSLVRGSHQGNAYVELAGYTK